MQLRIPRPLARLIDEQVGQGGGLFDQNGPEDAASLPRLAPGGQGPDPAQVFHVKRADFGPGQCPIHASAGDLKLWAALNALLTGGR